MNATSANSEGVLVKNDDDYNENYDDGNLETTYSAGAWIAKYPGLLGNTLKVSVCPSATAFKRQLTGNVSITANTTTVTGDGTDFSNEVIVGDILRISGEHIKVTSVTNATSLELKSRHIQGATDVKAMRFWEYWFNVERAPKTSPYATDAGGSNDEMHVAVVDEDGEYSGRVDQVLEVFNSLSMASDAKAADGSSNYYKDVINQRSRFIRWASHGSDLTNAGTKASGTSFGNPDTPITYSLVGGSDGGDASDGDYINGYNLFKSAEDVDVSLILCADKSHTVAVYNINSIAEHRKDCIALISPPRVYAVDNQESAAEDIEAYRDGLPSSSYAVLDSGWKYQYDKYNDLYRYVPLNGDVGGLMVRTDNTRDPWWSPAGFNRGHIKNVVKLSFNPRKADRDLLYQAGINPVVTFPGQGTILFGDKTLLAHPSAFDRINVRRLFIVLEKAIATAAKFTLFEFNDEFTRAQFRNMVEPFLRDVKGRRRNLRLSCCV